MPEIKRLAILDDYQGLTLSHPDWARLPGIEKTVFQDTLKDEDALVARLAPFDAILAMRERTPFPRSLIERLPNLKLLITTGERNRGIDDAACKERGITLCGTSSFGAPTVEITWGLIINMMRGLPEQAESMRAGNWQRQTLLGGVGSTVEGKTLGVVGLGKLGTRVAKVGQAFGMKVVAWSQNLTDEAAAAVGATRVSKEELLRTADVVTLHLLLSERSRGIIAAPDLALMKKSAIIINTSRGPLIDQDALIAALKAGTIAGAGIDVYDIEPIPPAHPLLSAPHALLTPHLGYVSAENFAQYFKGAVEVIEAYLAGSPIRIIG
ncbi:D-2-hydroxyacid dehydrogenase family protein [Rhodovarius crocodyli]|uniref:D-2-hydroxyacid dehydrogenase family protein n=1 Tax=Rhodovarius crocodyli TaxID=1979269 RepID=A0A437MHG4_9PROT|nr:D-2-hydroxyacid dehydrogenase family protein [Rhodovarius crocodyli]RVT97087.1 D-2-hydroxyacid dehydrogenase family protein [Rhodovarius crocodyli]